MLNKRVRQRSDELGRHRTNNGMRVIITWAPDHAPSKPAAPTAQATAQPAASRAMTAAAKPVAQRFLTSPASGALSQQSSNYKANAAARAAS